MKFKIVLILYIISVSLLLNQNRLHAQSFGAGIGVAGVENFDGGQFNWTVLTNLPISNRVFCNISYTNWQGEDANYILSNNFAYESEGLFHGNSGLNFLLFYRLFDKDQFSTSVGAGVGRYEMIQLSMLNGKQFFQQSTFILSNVTKYNLLSSLSIYSKLDICFDEIVTSPEWGIFNIGIELYPFN